MTPCWFSVASAAKSVVIGGNIEVTVLEVHGDRVKLGLRGPAEVPFRREEICRRRKHYANKDPVSRGMCVRDYRPPFCSEPFDLPTGAER